MPTNRLDEAMLKDTERTRVTDKTQGETCVRVARTMEEVFQLQPTWTAMQGHPNADFDFYGLVLRSRPGIVRPHVISVMRGGIIEAILAGRLEFRSIEASIGYRRIKLSAAPCLTFIHGGFMGKASAQNCHAIMASVQRALGSNEAVVAAFNSFESNSFVVHCALTVPSLLCRDYVPSITSHRSMVMPPRYDDIFAGMSTKTRKNLKWQAKKLVGDYHGQVRVRHFRDTNELHELFQHVEGIASTTYQRGLGVGFVDDEFTRERFQMAANKGELHAFVLYLHDQPRAFWIGTVYGETFHSDFMGYDPQHSRYSPGMYLILQTIDEFYRSPNVQRITSIDFGLGDAQYKAVLGDRCWSDASMYVFAPSIRGITINLIRTPIALLNQSAMRFLEKTQFLSRVKKIWRRQAAAIKADAPAH